MKERYTPEKLKSMQIICPSPDGYGNTKKVSKARKASAAGTRNAHNAVVAHNTVAPGAHNVVEHNAVVVSSSTLKFTDLCEDIIRLVCDYLDVESHIALYLALVGMPPGSTSFVQRQLYPKIQTMKYSCLYTITHAPKPDGECVVRCSQDKTERDTDLVYCVAMLTYKERAQLRQACGGMIPYHNARGLYALQPLLTDHAQLLETPRFKAEAKRYLQKYGALRAHPAARDYIEKRAIQCVRRKPQARLQQFIALAFDLNLNINPWKTTPTNQTPGCFQDPLNALEEVLQDIPAAIWTETEEGVVQCYLKWHRRFMANDNRRQKYGNIVLAADARFKQVLKATQVEKECRLHEKIYRAYLKQVQQDQVQQDQDQAEQDQAQQDQDQAAKHLFEEKVKAELKIFRVVIKHMDD
jgi:hypothetical protein